MRLAAVSLLLVSVLAVGSVNAQLRRHPVLAAKANDDIAKWRRNGLVAHWGGREVSTDSDNPRVKGDTIAGFGAAIAFFLTLGMVEAFKSDCPDHIESTSWATILAGQGLSDGDKFQLQDLTALTTLPPELGFVASAFGVHPGDHIDDGQIAINFSLGKGVNWRKYVLAGDAPSNSTRTVASAEGEFHQSGFFFIPAGPSTEVVLAKPKKFGNLCKMHQIVGTAGLEPGHIYLLTWTHD